MQYNIIIPSLNEFDLEKSILHVCYLLFIDYNYYGENTKLFKI
jgi:hypothetical protein